MALNKPRTIPFDFQVVEIDGWVWLFDNSERTYLCSAFPNIWAEPLYSLGEDETDHPESDYFPENVLECNEAKAVPVDNDAELNPVEAWDDAREEANANHIL